MNEQTLVRVKNLRDLPVFSMLQGKKIADVKDTIYDPFKNKITALLLYPNGIFSKERFVLFEDIKSVGKDAIIVDSSLVLKKAEEIDKHILNLKNRDKLLLGTKIVTENGEQLGTVTDYFFDQSNGKVSKLELSQGGFADFKTGKKIISISNILSMGPDATIVELETAYDIYQQSQTQGLQGNLNRTSDTLEQNTQNLKMKFEEAKSKIASYLKPKEEDIQPQSTKNLTSKNPYPQTLEDISYKPTDIPQEVNRTPENYTNFELDKPAPKSQARMDYDDAMERLKALSEKTQNKIVDLKNKAEEELLKVKQDPQNQEKFQTLKENIRASANQTQEKFNQYQTVAYNQISKVKNDRMDIKKKNAVGLFLTKTILDSKDQVLAARGDIVTNKLLAQAEELGIIDQVLKNTSYDPIT